MTGRRPALAACALAVLPLACAPATSPDAGTDAGEEELINPPDAGPVDGGMPPPNTDRCPTEGPFLTHAEEGNVTHTVVTACSDARWVALDLDDRTETLLADPPPSEGWDLAFQRYHVMSNGGVSGAGGVRVAPLTGVDFDDVTEAPADGWLEDLADSDLDGHDDYVISGQDLSWWEYDLETHVINMTGVIWVVETTEGARFKLEFVDYYADVNGNAESGYPTFVWARLDEGGDVDAGTPDVGDAGDAGDAG